MRLTHLRRSSAEAARARPEGAARIPSGDLCKLPVLFLLPNSRLLPEFLDCTAFIGFLKAQQSPSNLRFGNGKLDIKGNPVLNSHMDDFSFLLGDTTNPSWMLSRLRDVEFEI